LSTQIDTGGFTEARLKQPKPRHLIYRHSAIVRVTHWINVLCLTILLMSGLQIFNAHPALYWGPNSNFNDPILEIGATEGSKDNPARGITTIFGHDFDTTGVLGLSKNGDGEWTERGFPAWATIPGPQWLAMGRRWHFFFAWLFVINGLVYAASALISGHFWALVPTPEEFKHIGRTIWDHLRFHFPKGEEAKRYNVLQKLAYFGVIFVAGPLVVLAGLTMSPRIDAGFPVLLHLFDGRQSARTIHFLCAFAFLAFVAIHLFMVLISGAWNNLRSMITGRYDIGEADEPHAK
jgi:thiosulfate reductase cytochrome b subunit